MTLHLLCFSFLFTFHISIPVFPIGQVHVDVCTQLWSAGGEHTKDFVLIKSRFLKTAHESSLFQQLQAPRHTPRSVTNPKPQPGCVTPFSHSERGKCVGLDVEVRSTSSLTCNIPHKVLPDYTNAVLTHLHTPPMLKGHGTVGEHRYVHGNKRPSASPLLTCVLAEKLFQRTSPAI